MKNKVEINLENFTHDLSKLSLAIDILKQYVINGHITYGGSDDESWCYIYLIGEAYFSIEELSIILELYIAYHTDFPRAESIFKDIKGNPEFKNILEPALRIFGDH